MLILGPKIIEQLFGFAFLSTEARAILNEADLRYERVAEAERIQIIQEEEEAVDNCAEPVSSFSRLAAWDSCWNGARAQWEASGMSPDHLVPLFLRAPGPICRLLGEYIRPRSPHFLWLLQRVLLSELAARYLFTADRVIEFGCGSGFNLHLLRSQRPDLSYFGLDRSEAAVEFAAATGLNAFRFDIEYPQAHSPSTVEGAAVLTAGALEQIGDRFEEFLRWLIAGKPKVCVHIEPILEFYADSTLDDTAARYHRARGYLAGFWPRLLELRSRGKITMQGSWRVRLGARHNDGFSWVVWKMV